MWTTKLHLTYHRHGEGGDNGTELTFLCELLLSAQRNNRIDGPADVATSDICLINPSQLPFLVLVFDFGHLFADRAALGSDLPHGGFKNI